MKLTRVLLTACLSLISATAMAGKSQPAPVTIDLVNRVASGDMVAARFSSNEEELIGCGVRYYEDAGGAITYAFCQARLDASETGLILCSTFNTELIEAIQSISAFSFVTFSWNEDNECTRIGNSSQSMYIPNFRLRRR